MKKKKKWNERASFFFFFLTGQLWSFCFKNKKKIKQGEDKKLGCVESIEDEGEEEQVLTAAAPDWSRLAAATASSLRLKHTHTKSPSSSSSSSSSFSPHTKKKERNSFHLLPPSLLVHRTAGTRRHDTRRPGCGGKGRKAPGIIGISPYVFRFMSRRVCLCAVLWDDDARLDSTDRPTVRPSDGSAAAYLESHSFG